VKLLTDSPGYYTAEVRAAWHLARTTIPTPQLVSHGVLDETRRWLAYQWHDLGSFTPTPPLVRHAGELLGRLHADSAATAVPLSRIRRTGSQDEASQVRDITADAAARAITLVKIIKLHGYSASHGTQEPALQEIIAGMERGDWFTLLVTDSRRIDRREDLDAQAAVLLAIRSAGGDVISITESNYGQTDFAGRIVTLVAQHANAENSKTVKNSTYRGISMIRDNNAHHGPLPSFWGVKGERYAKQAYCSDPEVGTGEPSRSLAGRPFLAHGLGAARPFHRFLAASFVAELRLSLNYPFRPARAATTPARARSL
jgi:hypothetical protein